MPVVGQEDSPSRVRDVLGLPVYSPSDLFGLADVPNGTRVWSKDLGNPHVPGGNVHRGSKDGRSSGKEQNSKSGREFHRESGFGFVRGVEGGGSWVDKVGKP